MRKMRRPSLGLGLGAREGAGVAVSGGVIEDVFLRGNA
jgi:hypothetical protein